MAFLVLGDNSAPCGGDAQAVPYEDPLQTGFIREGGASDPTGEAWYDTSSGPSYGCGRRFQHEETAFMTRIKSKHKR